MDVRTYSDYLIISFIAENNHLHDMKIIVNAKRIENDRGMF